MRETLAWKFRILRVCDKNQEQLATYTLNRFSFEQRWSAREHHSLTTGICFYCHRHIHIHVAHKPSRMFALCLPPFVTTQHNSVLPSTTLIIQRFKDVSTAVVSDCTKSNLWKKNISVYENRPQRNFNQNELYLRPRIPFTF